MKTPRITVLLALGLLGLGTAAFAQAQADDRGYGRDLMTDEERAEHRDKMRSMDSDEEREQYRREHHEMMKQRAQKRGVELPDKPPEHGQGGGPGPGKGYGQ
jgi:nicotinamide riboside kinase